MAAVMRCSCFLLSPPSDLSISGNPHFPGKLESLVFKVEKFGSLSGDGYRVPFLFRHKFSADETSCLRPAMERTEDMIQVPPSYEKFFEQLSVHQGKLKLRSSAITFLVANALIWTTPFEALAETCEADNSIFNMPLLLFVALIGATVGGMVPLIWVTRLWQL